MWDLMATGTLLLEADQRTEFTLTRIIYLPLPPPPPHHPTPFLPPSDVTEVRQRTEMEVLLRDCAEDVKNAIKSKKKLLGVGGDSAAQGRTATSRQSILGTSKEAGGVTVDDFSADDREKVLELLFAKERVISLLYSRAFPPTDRQSLAPGDLLPNDGLSHEDVSELYKLEASSNNNRPSTSSEALSHSSSAMMFAAPDGHGGMMRPGTAA